MNTELIREYRKLRGHGWIVGEDAKMALSGARTILAFKELEEAGRVRLVADPEEEDYFSVYGEPDSERERKAISEAIQQDGLWYVHADVKGEPCRCCGRGDEWENVDGIGMCIYDDPVSPYENAYVLGLMQTAVEKAAH